MLTKNDLQLIEDLLDKKLDKRFDENNTKLLDLFFKYFPTKDEAVSKKEFQELKQTVKKIGDTLVEMKEDLEKVRIPILENLYDSHEKKIQQHEVRIKRLEFKV